MSLRVSKGLKVDGRYWGLFLRANLVNKFTMGVFLDFVSEIGIYTQWRPSLFL
jgi:hypothetical protein